MRPPRLSAVSACLLAALALSLGACTTQPGPVRTESQPSPASRAPKIMTIGIQREPDTVNQVLAGSPAGGVTSLRRVVQSYLVVLNDKLTPVPQLAADTISLEQGNWRLNPDGTMDTIWRLRPNVRWHDGAPFTSGDLLFAFNVYKDPEVPTREGGVLALMESASAPDPLTFIVHWSSPFVRANEAIGLEPLPRHLLEEQYTTDKANLGKSPRFTVDFVGLGPYRMTSWEPGLQAQFARFDEFFMGRPPLDSVIVRFMPDENAMVANILSGAVDALMPTGVSLESAIEVKRRWEGTDNQVRSVIVDRLRFAEPQHRSEYARPAEGLTNVTTRQALAHAVDRQTLADIVTLGQSAAADSWFPPTSELRRPVEETIPKFPYDLRRAQDLLAQAGWRPGADGVLVHGQSGARFEVELMGVPGRSIEKEQAVVADGLKALGADVRQVLLPSAQRSDPERNATFSGFRFSGSDAVEAYAFRFHSSSVPSAANRWSGQNNGGYSDTRADALLERVVATIPLAERIPIHRELVQKVVGEVAFIPFFWEVEPVLVLGGVKGIVGREPWNMFEWDKDA